MPAVKQARNNLQPQRIRNLQRFFKIRLEYLELFYWLQKIGYQGYLSIDQYPYREDSLQAAQQSLDWMTMLERTASRIDPEKMDAILKDQDAVASTRYIREILLGA